MIAVADAPVSAAKCAPRGILNRFCRQLHPAASDRNSARTGLDEAFRVALAVHHAGSAYDYFTVEASKQYESFYSGKRYSRR